MPALPEPAITYVASGTVFRPSRALLDNDLRVGPGVLLADVGIGPRLVEGDAGHARRIDRSRRPRSILRDDGVDHAAVVAPGDLRPRLHLRAIRVERELVGHVARAGE